MKTRMVFFLTLAFILASGCLSARADSPANNDKDVVFYEGFNDVWEPWGWNIVQLGTGIETWQQALPGYQGFGAQHTYTLENGGTIDSWLISPPITLAPGQDYLLSFWEKNMYQPYGPASLSAVFVSAGSAEAGHADFVMLYESDEPIDDYIQTNLSLSEYAGESIRLAFVYRGTYSHNWYVDEVTVRIIDMTTTVLTMDPPQGEGSPTPAVGTHTYQFEAGNAPTEALSAHPGLGFGFGSWNGAVEEPLHARTNIVMDQDQTVQAIFTPYDESYSLFWHKHTLAVGGGTNSSVSPDSNLEGLDNFSNSSIETITKLVVYGYAEYYDGGSVEWTPGETEPFIVRFYDAPQNALPNALGPALSTQHVNARVYKFQRMQIFPTSWRNVYKFELALNEPVNLQSGWVSVQINKEEGPERWFIWMGGQQGNGNNFSFRRNRANQSFMVMNYDLSIEIWGTQEQELPIPACSAASFPQDGATSVGYPIGAHPTIELQWQEVPNADGYSLYFGETLPEEGMDMGSQLSFTPGGLSYETTYQWKIIPYNEQGSPADCPVFSFTTRNDPSLYPPFSVFFDPDLPNWQGPLDWEDRNYGKLQDQTSFSVVNPGQWTYRPFAHIPGNARAAMVNLNAPANPPVYAWFISPPISLEEGHNNSLFFDLAVTQVNVSTPGELGSQDIMHVLVSDDGGLSWTPQQVVFSFPQNPGDQLNPGGQSFSVPLHDYSGHIKLGFYAERELPGSAIQLFIGNIHMEEAFSLSLAAQPGEGGTLSGAGSYAPGTQVSILAEPATGYAFVAWQDAGGNVISTQAAHQFVMPAENTSLTAIFELQTYSFEVIVQPAAGGSVQTDPDLEAYTMGSSINLMATPAEDYEFLHWKQGQQIIGEDPQLTFTMPAENVVITAHFSSTLIPLYTLSLLADPQEGGSVEGAGEYEAGSQVSIQAIANEDYAFINWTNAEGVEITSQASFTITMPAQAITLIARFQSNVHAGQAQEAQILIYPNPAPAEGFFLRSDQPMQRIELLDLSGKLLYSAEQAGWHHRVQPARLPAGMYLIRVSTPEQHIIQKISIQ